MAPRRSCVFVPKTAKDARKNRRILVLIRSRKRGPNTFRNPAVSLNGGGDGSLDHGLVDVLGRDARDALVDGRPFTDAEREQLCAAHAAGDLALESWLRASRNGR